jgi:hypothetical protein
MTKEKPGGQCCGDRPHHLRDGEKGKYSLFFAVFEALSSLPTFLFRGLVEYPRRSLHHRRDFSGNSFASRL